MSLTKYATVCELIELIVDALFISFMIYACFQHILFADGQEQLSVVNFRAFTFRLCRYFWKYTRNMLIESFVPNVCRITGGRDIASFYDREVARLVLWSSIHAIICFITIYIVNYATFKSIC